MIEGMDGLELDLDSLGADGLRGVLEMLGGFFDAPGAKYEKGEYIRWQDSDESFQFIFNETADWNEYKARDHWAQVQGVAFQVLSAHVLTLRDGSKCVFYSGMDEHGLLEIIPEHLAEFVF